MRRFFLLLLLWMPLTTVFAQAFQEGVHFERVAPADTRDPEAPIQVTEFFWYGCPHCYSLEPAISTWLETKPDNVEFQRVPAPLNPRWAVHARAYYVADVLGKVDDIHMPLFRAIHEEHRALMTKESLAQYFTQFGISQEEFDKTWDSFAVQTRLQKALNNARRFRLTGVPSVIINDEFVTSMASSGGRVFEVVNYLVGQIEAREAVAEAAE